MKHLLLSIVLLISLGSFAQYKTLIVERETPIEDKIRCSVVNKQSGKTYFPPIKQTRDTFQFAKENDCPLKVMFERNKERSSVFIYSDTLEIHFGNSNSVDDVTYISDNINNELITIAKCNRPFIQKAYSLILTDTGYNTNISDSAYAEYERLIKVTRVPWDSLALFGHPHYVNLMLFSDLLPQKRIAIDTLRKYFARFDVPKLNKTPVYLETSRYLDQDFLQEGDAMQSISYSVSSSEKVHINFTDTGRYYTYIWSTRCIPCLKTLKKLDTLLGENTALADQLVIVCSDPSFEKYEIAASKYPNIKHNYHQYPDKSEDDLAHRLSALWFPYIFSINNGVLEKKEYRSQEFMKKLKNGT